MDVIVNILKDSVGGGFWNFIGYWLILAMIVTSTTIIISRTLNFLTILTRGRKKNTVNKSGKITYNKLIRSLFYTETGERRIIMKEARSSPIECINPKYADWLEDRCRQS